MKNKNTLHSAFTLVELAIVIVIIGLLVGGVLAGQELITQAKYRAAMKDIEGYKTAFLGFKAKYNCLPGDCLNSHRFFGDKNCGTNSFITTANPTGCNGNGDGIYSIAEGQLVWFQLGTANFIKGSFAASYKTNIIAGIDVPMIPVKDSVGISISFANGSASNTTSCGFTSCANSSEGIENILGYMVNKNVLMVGNARPSTGGTAPVAQGSFMTPVEAYEFDMKFDDGKAFYGTISGFKGRTLTGTPANCTNTAPNGAYFNQNDLYKNQESCIMVFDSGLH